MTGLLDRMNELADGIDSKKVQEEASKADMGLTSKVDVSAKIEADKVEPKALKETKPKKDANKKAPTTFKTKVHAKGKAKNSTGKKSPGMANADKLQAIVQDNKNKNGKAPCKKASKLHKHLHTVGADGMTHKDRIEKEVKEQADRWKRRIKNTCFTLIGLGIIVAISIHSCDSTPTKTATKRKPVKRSAAHISAIAYKQLKSSVSIYVKQDDFDKKVFFKMFDDYITKYPENKESAEGFKDTLMRVYKISE